MGGVPRPAARGVGRGLGSLGAGRFAAEIPQAPPRPEEAEAQEAERGQDQTRGHREASPSASYMYKMTPPRGLAHSFLRRGENSFTGVCLDDRTHSSPGRVRPD